MLALGTVKRTVSSTYDRSDLHEILRTSPASMSLTRGLLLPFLQGVARANFNAWNGISHGKHTRWVAPGRPVRSAATATATSAGCHGGPGLDQKEDLHRYQMQMAQNAVAVGKMIQEHLPDSKSKCMQSHPQVWQTYM